jgi:ADP-ribosylglycohydrolase
VGDALGAPVEFDSWAQIVRRHGPRGLAGYEEKYGRRGAITDDTQMTLFTAEGILRSAHRPGEGMSPGVVKAVHEAYLRWLTTQGELRDPPGGREGLLAIPELHSRRAPGTTCLASLGSGRRGSRSEPLNDRKGCGTVMRIAPVGLAAFADPFAAGCDLAALTHGHPTGILAAGCLAQVVDELVHGNDLPGAAHRALERLGREEGGEETRAAVLAALRLAKRREASAAMVESLGQGWVAEEALAIGLYCALVAGGFEEGVLLAVNHGGDSDSTGAIAGNLLGMVVGEEGIPVAWLDELELREVTAGVADELYLRARGS